MGFTCSIRCSVILITIFTTIENTWESAGNISEAAYILSVIYVPFIFVHRTSSFVCQIMYQKVEVMKNGRHLDRSSKRQMKSSEAREKEGSGCLLLVILKVVKDEKEITMR